MLLYMYLEGETEMDKTKKLIELRSGRDSAGRRHFVKKWWDVHGGWQAQHYHAIYENHMDDGSEYVVTDRIVTIDEIESFER